MKYYYSHYDTSESILQYTKMVNNMKMLQSISQNMVFCPRMIIRCIYMISRKNSTANNKLEGTEHEFNI